MYQHLLEKIDSLKKQRNAVILAHNYQPGDIQDLADFCGDSLALSIQAANTSADVIVFCGVLFMAETASILSPQKTVLLPEIEAGCPMANMITADQLKKFQADHPGAITVCYVNSTAEVKAQSDYCCTSANAVELVKLLPDDADVLFVPDQHLGQHVIDNTRDRRGKIFLWPGYCPTHQMVSEDDIKKAKKKHPGAIVLAHPECPEPVKAVSDEILSTGQMLRFAKQSKTREFIIATEIGILHTLRKQNPDAKFYPANEYFVCPNMKKITPDKIIHSLETMSPVITVDEETRNKARKALDRMIEVVPR